MAIICIAIIAIGSAISLISFWISLKLTFSTALRNPFFCSQLLSLIGLCGLILYGTDFIDANRYQLSFTIGANLPALLEAVSKNLWPILAFILLSCIARKILPILQNPNNFLGILQAIYGNRNQQNAIQGNGIQNRVIADSKNLDSDYKREEYNNLKSRFAHDSAGELLEFAVLQKIIADFEYIFNIIYGSQISTLKTLAKNIQLDVHSFYDEYLVKQKSLLPKLAPLSYDQWEGFLIRSGLAAKEGSLVKILPKGLDFINYISQKPERAL